MVITPGIDLLLDLTHAIGLAFLESLTARCLARCFAGLLRIDLQDFLDQFLVSCLDVFNVFRECQAHIRS